MDNSVAHVSCWRRFHRLRNTCFRFCCRRGRVGRRRRRRRWTRSRLARAQCTRLTVVQSDGRETARPDGRERLHFDGRQQLAPLTSGRVFALASEPRPSSKWFAQKLSRSLISFVERRRDTHTHIARLRSERARAIQLSRLSARISPESSIRCGCIHSFRSARLCSDRTPAL